MVWFFQVPNCLQAGWEVSQGEFESSQFWNCFGFNILGFKRAKAFYNQPLHLQEESWKAKKAERKKKKKEASAERFQVVLIICWFCIFKLCFILTIFMFNLKVLSFQAALDSNTLDIQSLFVKAATWQRWRRGYTNGKIHCKRYCN